MFLTTFLRNNVPFLTIVTAIVFFACAANAVSAQIGGKAEFQGLDEALKNLKTLDPIFNLRETNPQGFKNFSENAVPQLNDLRREIDSLAGETDISFNPSINLIAGTVSASVFQTDGKLVAGGYFKTVNGSRHDNIIRFNFDNTIDESFAASTNGTVMNMKVQPDGKIVIAGVFTVVNGTNRNGLARLNADGSLDTSFNPGIGTDNLILDLSVLADGKIIIAGNFTGINGYFSPSIARLNADGSPDPTFASRISPPGQANISSIVYSFAVQPDGKPVLAGVIAIPFTSGIKFVVRLNVDGTFDESFNIASLNSNPYKIVIQPDGKFLIGGFFQTVGGVARRYLARLNPDGSLDTSFDPMDNASAPVSEIVLKPDGKILFGGFASSSSLAKQLNANGTLDISFNVSNSFASDAETISLKPNGQVFVGSSFRTDFGSNSAAFLFNADGTRDSSFSFQTTSAVYISSIAVQTDGKILIGGAFNRINGMSRNNVARLNADGTLDASFTLGNNSQVFVVSNSQISDILIQPDGKILIGGAGLSTGTGFSSPIVRVNQDGSYDNSFSVTESLRSKSATVLALRPDGKITFGYTGFNASRVRAGGIARINSDGSLDSTFNFSFEPTIKSIVTLPDGKILAGGPFYLGFINSGTGQNELYYGLIRLNEEGLLDRTFRPGFVSNSSGFTEVNSIAVQSDGRILAGGRLITGSSAQPVGVARLDSTGALDGSFQLNPIASTNDLARVEKVRLLPTGKILTAGRFNNFGGAMNANIVRLNTNGSPDPAFQTKTDKTVRSIAQQPNGKIIIGGEFDTVNDIERPALARLLSEPVAVRRARFDYDGDGKSDVSLFRPSNSVWYLNNSTGGFSAVQWGVSGDLLTPADYDGDGKTDVAVYRNGIWYLLRSTVGFTSIQFGQAGDIAQPADFDGDGKAELAVFRPSNGTWYSLNLANGQNTIVQFGSAEDKPVAADYDGDGKTDIAVFRPSSGTWYVIKSSGGVSVVQWGVSTDRLVPADYDGDGKDDIAVYRDGVWYVLKSSGQGNLIVQWGISTDVPAPADYDGDGKTDPAIFRDGIWYILQTTSGSLIYQFGQANDKPTANSFVY